MLIMFYRQGKIPSYFLYFLLYNLVFFALQLLLIYHESGSFISQIKLPLKIYLELIATFCVHIGLYAILSLVQTLILVGLLKRPWHYWLPEQWQIIIWILFICFILSANSYFFPLSVFSKLFSPPIPQSYILTMFSVSLLAISLLLLNSMLYQNILVKLLFLFIGFICFTLLLHVFKPTLKYAPLAQPNIIILGIDSLSPESINKENMPFLNQFLKQSIQFTHTVSPLARTYPAWVSILTGLYAEHHHAEENLIAKASINSQTSIAWLLNKQGYDTFYATDDRRFNSIDQRFGFKHIIGPKLGVNDVLLGTFNDFPLSNLLINSRISAWLFPYNHMSRASFFSYYPHTFSLTLENALFAHDTKKPIFLAVHFTLSHWPYAWASSAVNELNNEFSIDDRNSLYQKSLTKVDEQLQNFFIYLKENQYLKNSLVIILSDHGETLYLPNSRLTNYSNYQGTLPSRFAEYLNTQTGTVLDKSAGHGSDILSPNQYHCVLAFNIYQKNKLITRHGKITTRVALIDLAPTILDFLHLNKKFRFKMDGVSLLKSIINPLHALPERLFYIESGMFPNQIISKERAMRIGHLFYKVNPLSGELEIKPSKLQYFDNQKLYGIISGQWILALYPDKSTYIPIIQNLSNGQWTDDLHSTYAQKTPKDKLYQHLQQFYGPKIFLPLP